MKRFKNLVTKTINEISYYRNYDLNFNGEIESKSAEQCYNRIIEISDLSELLKIKTFLKKGETDNFLVFICNDYNLDFQLNDYNE
jgi:hypothetical protein